MDLASFPTPALVLDRGKLARNGRTMLDRCRARGVGLRPHMKTLKSAEAARLALDPSHGGIAVATLNEAEYFAVHGFLDIQLAVCLDPGKLPRAAALSRLAPAFGFFIDSIEMADGVAAFSLAEASALRVWIEVDCGEHRTGVDPESPDLLEIARRLEVAPGVVMAGLATHAGHAYGAPDIAAIRAIAEQERSAIVRAAERLRGAGIAVSACSVGSTPTALHGDGAAGITEVRAGVYMAGDLFQANIGSLAREDLAVTVLATVISHNRSRNQIVIDAGGLALSKDRSTAGMSATDYGYGLALDVEGHPRFGDLIVADVHQEHGEIRSDSPLPFDALPIGARVRVAPNHVCMTAAMYEEYLVVDGGAEVVDRWSRTNRWQLWAR